MKLVDCTLRDGGYYNAWDFAPELVQAYLEAMRAIRVDVVEVGFRFLKNDGYKGPFAYTTDDYVRSLNIPEALTPGVMLNGGDLLTDYGFEAALQRLFPEAGDTSPIDLVRIACHFREFERVLPASRWLSERGFRVGFNLMQISDRSEKEVQDVARMASDWPIEVLYFADSMGSMSPDQTAEIAGWVLSEWDGALGVHTHDNKGLALQNTMRAHAAGATWLDSTVMGMGRGPGNARTEELVIEAEKLRDIRPNLVPLLTLIREHFAPMKDYYKWGSNLYYFLSGEYGIHPTYIQKMLVDSRYQEEDVLSVIEHLRKSGGKSFNADTLDSARTFYSGPPRGSWAPASMLEDREVLILGAGPGARDNRFALENYIKKAKPVVIALNTQNPISADLIDLRAACHPLRLMADCDLHADLPHPLIAPFSMLPDDLRSELSGKDVLDFGISVDPSKFSIGADHCTIPNSLVLAYALAAAGAGKAQRILLAGFDGYASGDPRNEEVETALQMFNGLDNAPSVTAITPTRYKNLDNISVYGLLL